jgi:hypothetical protein
MARNHQQDLDMLRRFGSTPEGRLLVAVLQDRLADCDRRNRRAIGEDLYRSQGRALEIEELLQSFDASLASAPGQTMNKPQPNRPLRLPIVNHMAD